MTHYEHLKKLFLLLLHIVAFEPPPFAFIDSKRCLSIDGYIVIAAVTQG